MEKINNYDFSFSASSQSGEYVGKKWGRNLFVMVKHFSQAGHVVNIYKANTKVILFFYSWSCMFACYSSEVTKKLWLHFWNDDDYPCTSLKSGMNFSASFSHADLGILYGSLQWPIVTSKCSAVMNNGEAKLVPLHNDPSAYVTLKTTWWNTF